MKHLHVLTVGKLKVPHWKMAAEHYQKRLQHSLSCRFISVKDGDAKLSVPKRMEAEALALCRQIKASHTIICLDERGKMRTSTELADFLCSLWDTGAQPLFTVGGAFGLAPSLKKTAHHLMALGPMTFPHELAQVVLLEQLYRAESILQGSKYHHE